MDTFLLQDKTPDEDGDKSVVSIPGVSAPRRGCGVPGGAVGSLRGLEVSEWFRVLMGLCLWADCGIPGRLGSLGGL